MGGTVPQRKGDCKKNRYRFGLEKIDSRYRIRTILLDKRLPLRYFRVNTIKLNRSSQTAEGQQAPGHSRNPHDGRCQAPVEARRRVTINSQTNLIHFSQGHQSMRKKDKGKYAGRKGFRSPHPQDAAPAGGGFNHRKEANTMNRQVRRIQKATDEIIKICDDGKANDTILRILDLLREAESSYSSLR